MLQVRSLCDDGDINLRLDDEGADDVWYTVRMRERYCSCDSNLLGRACKHILGVKIVHNRFGFRTLPLDFASMMKEEDSLSKLEREDAKARAEAAAGAGASAAVEEAQAEVDVLPSGWENACRSLQTEVEGAR